MRTSKRKGFTLVELLIVIVVIGVLSAMMMLSSTEAVSSAQATKIINDLTNLKKAVTAWYLDNYSRFQKSDNGIKLDGKTELHEVFSSQSSELTKYFSNSFTLNAGPKNYDKDFYATVGGFSVYMAKGNTICLVCYRLSNDSKKKDQTRLREKLKARSKQANLLSYEKSKEPYAYDGGNFVFMEAFRLE